MNEQRRESFQQQAEQNIDAAAMQIARRIQTSGQSKEQTKLIAQGIAKGIALYKKQQNERLRERDKLRKKLAKERQHAVVGDRSDDEVATPSKRTAARLPVGIAASLLSLAAFLHLVRWVVALPVTMGEWEVPVWWSLPIALGLGGLTVWLVLGVLSRSRSAD